MLHNQVLNKNSIDSIFSCLANNYHGTKPINIYLVGGAAIMLHFDYRQSTIDFDALFQNNNEMEKAIKQVSDQLSLPIDWLNQDFVNTPSFSSKIIECSKLYKSFNDVVFVYSLEPMYLIAMKLKSSRPTGGDLDDIVKMIYELRFNNAPITFEKVLEAYRHLYQDFSNTYDYFLKKTKEAFETPMEEVEIVLKKHKVC